MSNLLTRWVWSNWFYKLFVLDVISWVQENSFFSLSQRQVEDRLWHLNWSGFCIAVPTKFSYNCLNNSASLPFLYPCEFSLFRSYLILSLSIGQISPTAIRLDSNNVSWGFLNSHFSFLYFYLIFLSSTPKEPRYLSQWFIKI